jgi:hypothetical protein
MSTGLAFSPIPLALVVASALGIIYLALHSMDEVNPTLLPPVGYHIAPVVRTSLPVEGGTLIIVSEACSVCRDRAEAYLARIERRHNEALVVIDASDQPIDVLATAHPEVSKRIAYVTSSELVQWTGVRVVPSYVTVDADGQVVRRGISRVGWMSGFFNLNRWLDGWSGLFRVVLSRTRILARDT